MEAYRSLRERDAVGRRHGFIAEGATVLVKAIRAGRYPIRSVLLSQKWHAGLADLLEALQSDIPVYVADQPVLDAICGFDLHRGVLALGAQPILPDPGELLAGMAERSTVVCLIGINDGEYMGSIFRNVASLGAQGVLLDDSCCYLLYRRAIRVSVGACLTVRSLAWLGRIFWNSWRSTGFGPGLHARRLDFPEDRGALRSQRPAVRRRGPGLTAGPARRSLDRAHTHGWRVRLAQCRCCQRHRPAPSDRRLTDAQAAPGEGGALT